MLEPNYGCNHPARQHSATQQRPRTHPPEERRAPTLMTDEPRSTRERHGPSAVKRSPWAKPSLLHQPVLGRNRPSTSAGSRAEREAGLGSTRSPTAGLNREPRTGRETAASPQPVNEESGSCYYTCCQEVTDDGRVPGIDCFERPARALTRPLVASTRRPP